MRKSFTINVTDVDEIAPTITAVYVRGSTWKRLNYLSFLAANMGGSSATYGYAIPAGSGSCSTADAAVAESESASPLPSVKMCRLLRHSLPLWELSAATVSRASPIALSIMWRHGLSLLPFGPDKLYVALPGSGSAPVTDAVRESAWMGNGITPAATARSGSTDTFPSGNGTAGGDFAFRFDVLPGDSTGGSLGKVNVADVAQTKSRSTLAVTVSSYRS